MIIMTTCRIKLGKQFIGCSNAKNDLCSMLVASSRLSWANEELVVKVLKLKSSQKFNQSLSGINY
jgi:hypothetical protein